MTEAKHEFVDDYPYLVYAANNKAVYTASGDTPYIPGGSEEWKEATEVSVTGEEDTSISLTVSQTAITDEPPTNTFLFAVTTSSTAYIPCGLYVTFSTEDEVSFTADQIEFTDYTTDGEGNYYFQIPECESFEITIGR